MNNYQMENQKKINNRNFNKSSREKIAVIGIKKVSRYAFKLIWGVDKLGSEFLFIKLKNLTESTSEKAIYHEKIFVPLYQNVKIDSAAVKSRISVIINYFNRAYKTVGVDGKAGKLSYRFIKGLVFKSYDEARDYYCNLIKNIVIHEIGNNHIDQNIFTNEDNYLLKTGILNYMK